MKTFKDLYEAANNVFKSTNGDVGYMTDIGSSTSTLYTKNSMGGNTSVDVHNSKLYIQTGKFKGKTVQDVYETDPDALRKLLKKSK